MSFRHPNKKWSITILIVVALIILVAFFVTRTRQEPATTGYVTHLNQQGLSIDGAYTLAKQGDLNKDGRVDGGDKVTFTFNITNKSKQAARTVTLDTGIDKTKLYGISEVKGSTGVETADNALLFKNIVLLPNTTQNLSFEAQVVRSPTDFGIHFRPVLIDPSNQVVLKGESKNVSVNKVDFAQITTQVNTIKNGGQ